jgi:hypothetical protein
MVLRLAACDRASGSNELAWRRPRVVEIDIVRRRQ